MLLYTLAPVCVKWALEAMILSHRTCFFFTDGGDLLLVKDHDDMRSVLIAFRF